jgi:AbrB family transcriptional regulator (stage V sporulation protein T)
MKATGIVRRIDELGRVVIPKEIRKTLRLSSGDPLEIFTERDELLFKKYSPIKSIDGFASQFAEGLSEISGHVAVVCDTDSVISTAGGGKEIMGRRISPELEQIIRDRRTVVVNTLEGGNAVQLTVEDEKLYVAQVISPVIVEGDVIGACILYSYSNEVRMRETDLKLAKMGADLLARRFSE